MSILEIIKYPNSLLLQRSVDVDDFDEKLEKLVSDMFETMFNNQGIGLAAPQVGILKNLLVISYDGRKLVLVNPVLIESSGIIIDEEGCLSCPGVNVYLERADKIKVKAKGIKGNDLLINEEGFFSRIIQHEMDHLTGVLIVNKKPAKIVEF